jgi:hypothetical protein
MKNYQYICLLGFCFFIVGCNPFGKNSFINITELINGGQTTTEINSGGKTEGTTPLSGNPADIHSISYSVGTPFRQTAFTTGNGHSVSISISGAKNE